MCVLLYIQCTSTCTYTCVCHLYMSTCTCMQHATAIWPVHTSRCTKRNSLLSPDLLDHDASEVAVLEGVEHWIRDGQNGGQFDVEGVEL